LDAVPGQYPQIHSGPMAGRVVLVTDGTGSIGEAIARVWLCWRSPPQRGYM